MLDQLVIGNGGIGAEDADQTAVDPQPLCDGPRVHLSCTENQFTGVSRIKLLDEADSEAEGQEVNSLGPIDAKHEPMESRCVLANHLSHSALLPEGPVILRKGM